MASITQSCLLCATIAVIGHGIAPGAADPFAEYVRSSEPLTPDAEAKTFRLPEGFEIQLFAAEPQITKPMNMAFDERGRLWITESREYPFPVPLDKKGRDTIKVLEDTDGDGRADSITTFADGLNIPIGIYPYKGGVIAWSIPNIWHFQDTDGDGKADKRDVLFGPLGWEKDTHGMNASFRRGFDGWIYATHGFNNTSVLKGRDGSELKLNSGNTYRVRPDGSRVEIHTWGQVNPFGLTFDPLGNLYSADCHSSPIYQLLRGGFYPSFGKPDDGLGFAPILMQHSHNSTAIGGIAYYADDAWPAEFRDNIFVGNVMTSRVNRDVVRFNGSSPSAKELPDFVSTSDPWFRPVDLQFGPDGALYVADFYNRIIGHYEVPLTHPGRDRERGRIWRVSYKSAKRGQPRFNLVGRTPEQVIAELASPNFTRRLLAMNHLVDNIGRAVLEPTRRALATSENPDTKLHCMWVLHRLGALDVRSISQVAAHRDARLRVHAMRVLSETKDWADQHRQLALEGLKDTDAQVQRAAADALAQHPAIAQLRPLVAAVQNVAREDNHLLHTVRMALRDQLKVDGAFASLSEAPALTERASRAVADVSVAVPTQAAGAFLLRHVEQYSEPSSVAAKYLRHIARYLPEDGVERLVQLARKQFAEDLDGQLAVFRSVHEGLTQQGRGIKGPAKMWGEDLATSLLKPPADAALDWQNTPIDGAKDTKNPWFVQRRQSADGTSTRFFCSLPPGGEQLTGILRSKKFPAPQRLAFFLAGHDGPPDKPAQGKNRVRLRAESGEVLMEAPPPRNDVAQKIEWDLTRHAGKPAYFEVVDGDTGGAYAWLAIGRFEPPAVVVPRADPSEIAKRQQAGADLARTLEVKRLQPQLAGMLASADPETQAAAGRAVAAFSGSDELIAVSAVLGEASAPSAVRQRAAALLVKPQDGAAISEGLAEVLRVSPWRLQVKVAQGLAGSTRGSATLVKFVKERVAPAALLQERSVKEKLVASDSSLAPQIEQLTKGLTPASETLQKLVEQRRKGFDSAKARSAEGMAIYTKNCAVCHQIERRGGLVGPQLDGIGNRGVERLCEDILDPNRSVDHAFRTTLLVLKDNDVVSGLLRREEGETIVLADSTGKEVTVQKKQVAERRESDTSLMPDNFGELLNAQEFNDLISYLLSNSKAH